MMLTPPSISSSSASAFPAPLQLLVLFERLLFDDSQRKPPEFHTLLLFHDNATIDVAAQLLAVAAGRVAAVAAAAAHITYNIDRHRPAPVPYAVHNGETLWAQPPLVPPALAGCFTSATLAVEVFGDADRMRVALLRMDVYLLRSALEARWVRVCWGRARYFYNDYRHMALVEVLLPPPGANETDAGRLVSRDTMDRLGPSGTVKVPSHTELQLRLR